MNTNEELFHQDVNRSNERFQSVFISGKELGIGPGIFYNSNKIILRVGLRNIINSRRGGS